MPKRFHYADLPFSEVLRMMADHHSKPSTRHITKDEANLLHEAADLLETLNSKPIVAPLKGWRFEKRINE